MLTAPQASAENGRASADRGRRPATFCGAQRKRISVLEMIRSAAAARLGSEFDDFLFAPIGEERNGMLLSVVSALARLGLDPWQEAAELAGLPGAPATQRLASLLAALPDRPSAHPDPGAIAARLIALLPRHVGADVAVRKKLPEIAGAINPWIVTYVVVMILALGTLWIATTHQAPAPVNDANTPAIARSPLSRH